MRRRTPPAARRGRIRVAVIAIAMVAPAIFGTSSALAQTDEVMCNGVFDGVTPTPPITKVANKTTAVLGEDITFTVGWTSTGVATADVTDCFRVDDGSSDTLNALVNGLNATKEVANVGDKGSPQSTTFTVTIPNDPSLIGHDLVDRVKITHGSVESRSTLVTVTIGAPPEVCEDNIDNDFDGRIDEDCVAVDDDEEEEAPPTRTPPKRPTEVLGGRTLPATGSPTTGIAWVGSMFLLAGIGLRTVRFQSVRQAFAGYTRAGAQAFEPWVTWTIGSDGIAPASAERKGRAWFRQRQQR